ncbi:MAG: toluene-4-monooxygenase system B family protein [Sandaracinaceae bacterium]
MALFPIYGRFVGDFVPHLVPADTDDDMNALAEKVAVHSVGRRVPPNPAAKGYEVLVNDEVVPAEKTLGELGLRPLEWVDVRWRE